MVLFLAGLFVMTEASAETAAGTGLAAERLLLLNTVTRTPQPPVKWDQMAGAPCCNMPGVQATALENRPLQRGAADNEPGLAVKGSVPSRQVLSFILRCHRAGRCMRIRRIDGRDARNDTSPSVASAPMVVGTATAVTPLLRDPLKGNAYLNGVRPSGDARPGAAVEGLVDFDLVRQGDDHA